ncbi:head GIN domain-containing protein [Salinimicrobium soli]|uniref:head GIN domain-containing protein n=1 Tax=Salinimicrobium soli TaxID=1254399 RepID=UPI003AB0AFDA
MKWKIKNQLVLLLLMLAVVPLTAQEITADLDAFREIKTFSGIEVQVYTSEKNRIEITGHSKEKVKFEVVENRLEIRLPIDNIWSKDNTLIKVYGNSFEIIDANEGSLVEVDGKITGKNLIFRAQEGATIEAEVDADKVQAKAVSGGSITLSGKADKQDSEANTGGKYHARDLKTKESIISVSTAGRAEVYATDYCKATAKLGGVVELYGRPKEVDQKTSLGGKIL